jgi:hypothetical protein
MERILSQLEEEAADAPSLAFRADELELLVAEFGVMDASLRKLVSAVDRGASELVTDEDLTELATDIPDLKARLGIADDGLASMSIELMSERAKNTVDESFGKLTEGAEFMARGVKMLGGDIVSSGTFFRKSRLRHHASPARGADDPAHHAGHLHVRALHHHPHHPAHANRARPDLSRLSRSTSPRCFRLSLVYGGRSS